MKVFRIKIEFMNEAQLVTSDVRRKFPVAERPSISKEQSIDDLKIKLFSQHMNFRGNAIASVYIRGRVIRFIVRGHR